MTPSKTSKKLVKIFPKRKPFWHSHVWFSELYNHSSVGAFISTMAEGRVLDVNDSFLEMVGLPREKVINQSAMKLKIWKDPQERDQILQYNAQNRSRKLFETQFKTQTGKTHHYLVHYEEMVFRGKPCFLSIYYDITWIKWTEYAYYTLFENSIQGIGIYQDHHLVFANATLASIFGYTVEEMLALPTEKIWDLSLPEDLGRLFEMYRPLRTQAEPARYEHKIFRKDGTSCWLEAFGTPILYHNRPALHFGVIDITERKLAEQALLESEEKFRSLYENAHDAILIDDENKIIKDINQSGVHLLGYDSAQEIIGRRSDELVAKDDLPRVRPLFRCFIQGTGNPCIPVEYQVIRKDGTLVPIESTVSVLTSPSGDFTGTVVISRDIRERKLAEQKLRVLTRRLAEVEETERRLLAQELHDRVGQNLTALNISLNVINNQLTTQPVKILRERLNDSMNLVSETMERIRNVMGELHPPALEDYGIMAALRFYSSQFEHRTGIRVDVQGIEPEPRLSGAIEMTLFRIAQEALNNVLKHSQADQTIIRLETFDNKTRFTIQDDGIGFDSHQTKPFNTRPAWGMMTMQERAETIGGELTVESSPGSGVCIIVEINQK